MRYESFEEQLARAYELGKTDAQVNVDTLMCDSDVRDLLRSESLPGGMAFIGAYRRGAADFWRMASAAVTA